MQQPGRAPAAIGEWECLECGFSEEGVLGRRPAKCPECGALGDSLEFRAEVDEDWEDLDEEVDLPDDGFEEDEDDYDVDEDEVLDDDEED